MSNAPLLLKIIAIVSFLASLISLLGLPSFKSLIHTLVVIMLLLAYYLQVLLVIVSRERLIRQHAQIPGLRHNAASSRVTLPLLLHSEQSVDITLGVAQPPTAYPPHLLNNPPVAPPQVILLLVPPDLVDQPQDLEDVVDVVKPPRLFLLVLVEALEPVYESLVGDGPVLVGYVKVEHLPREQSKILLLAREMIGLGDLIALQQLDVGEYLLESLPVAVVLLNPV